MMATPIAVIDFETANSRSSSACQLGVLLLDGWKIVGECEWMIRPQRMYFSPQCVRVHGITARDCLNSPQWDRVWTELHPMIDGRTILAHNVGFDAAVLLGTCQLYDIAVPQFDLQCTRLIAKRAWPGQSGYGLAALSQRLEIQFRHHNALEDARACAQVAIAAANRLGAEDLEDLEEKLGLTRGRIWVDQIRQPRTVKRTRIEEAAEPQARYQPKLFRNDGTPSRSDQIRRTRLRADAILASCEDFKPLGDKHVVLANTLLGLDREDSVAFLAKLGATVQTKINLRTNYVIVGIADENGNLESQHGDQVAERNELGQPIRIMTQRQLLACIPSGLAIARGDW